jgi:branched-chain amino acid aminotransferase
MTIARDLGQEVREEMITRDQLWIADEVFMTGTAAEVTPVREIDFRKIGSGEPGPVTRRLQDHFFSAVKGKDDKRRQWLTIV